LLLLLTVFLGSPSIWSCAPLLHRQQELSVAAA